MAGAALGKTNRCPKPSRIDCSTPRPATAPPLSSGLVPGFRSGNRTRYPRREKPLLYPLSYSVDILTGPQPVASTVPPPFARERVGFEPTKDANASAFETIHGTDRANSPGPACRWNLGVLMFGLFVHHLFSFTYFEVNIAARACRGTANDGRKRSSALAAAVGFRAFLMSGWLGSQRRWFTVYSRRKEGGRGSRLGPHRRARAIPGLRANSGCRSQATFLVEPPTRHHNASTKTGQFSLRRIVQKVRRTVEIGVPVSRKKMRKMRSGWTVVVPRLVDRA